MWCLLYHFGVLLVNPHPENITLEILPKVQYYLKNMQLYFLPQKGREHDLLYITNSGDVLRPLLKKKAGKMNA